MKQEKVEKYSIRKFKVGVGSALIGLSFLGATGALDDIPVVNDVFGATVAHAQSYGTPPSFNVPNATLITTNNVPDSPMNPIYTEDSGATAGYKVQYENGTIGGRVEYTYRDNSTGDTRTVTYNYPSTPDKYRVGVQDTRETTYTDVETQYVADKERPKGDPDVVRSQGVRGREDHITSYRLDTYSGEVSPTNTRTEVVTEMQPKVVAVAAKDKVDTVTTPSPKKYVKDTTREKGQPNLETKGQDGKSVTTTTYTVNPTTGKVTENVGKPVVTPATETIIKVAAKDKVVATPIPSPKKYVKDDSRIKGQPNIVNQGQDGSSTVTTTYDVNPTTGVITDVVGKPVIKQPTETVIKVAAKDKVDVRALPIPTEYRKDSQRKKGLPNLISEGREGRETTTTTYNVNPTTGVITEVVGKPVTILATPKIIRVPAQDDSIVEEIPANKIYEADPSKDKGSENITVPGEKGKKVTPVTYDVNPKTGVITENRGTPIITPAGTTVVKVGTKSTTTVTPIPSPKKYVKDDTREKGAPDIETKGNDGSKTVTTTYQVNRNTGEVTGTDGTPVIVNPTETIIKVAAKDKVVEKELPSRVRYVGDESKENSTEPVRTEGKKGKEVTTTTYDVNPKTGEISENEKTERTEEPTDTVVTIGTKPKVELIKDGDKTIERTTRYKVNENTGEVVTTTTDRLVPKTEKEEVLEPEVVYEKDASREKGSENITIPGTKGKKVTPISYETEEGTGKQIEKLGEPVITPATNTIVKVAAKDKVVEKELPSRVRYVGDENKDHSTEPVRVEGKKGKEVTTTTYDVNPKTGEITENEKTERTEEPTDTVVTIGTKPKVELIKDGDRTIERTTRYIVNEDTGEVVTTTTDKLIPNKVESSNGDGELPPVVEVPEFNGGVNGDLDGNAAINDVPEYTGPLAGNGLTGEGEMVEPPVVEVPEFDLSKLPKEVKEEPKKEVPNVGTGLNSFNDGRKKPVQLTDFVPVATTKEEPKVDAPKEVSAPVTLEQKGNQDKQASTPIVSNNKEMKELPNTGTASNAALTLAGVTFAMFGTVMLAKKKD